MDYSGSSSCHVLNLLSSYKPGIIIIATMAIRNSIICVGPFTAHSEASTIKPIIEEYCKSGYFIDAPVT